MVFIEIIILALAMDDDLYYATSGGKPFGYGLASRDTTSSCTLTVHTYFNDPHAQEMFLTSIYLALHFGLCLYCFYAE